MRLNKYIASAGVCSRREADELIAKGLVKVNGEVCSLGRDVDDGETVEVRGTLVRPSGKKLYYALNKPAGFVTTMKDEADRPTVLSLMADVDERIFPVGRLDKDTTGLIIMTNDGDFANLIAHPSHSTLKVYRARVAGVLSDKRIAMLRKGVDIGSYVTAPAKVQLIKQYERSAVVEIGIHEGRNRQIRKMCEAVGNEVVQLTRIAIGPVRLGNLKEGHYRKLRQDEIDGLTNQ